jgi:hypothetical protein
MCRPEKSKSKLSRSAWITAPAEWPHGTGKLGMKETGARF